MFIRISKRSSHARQQAHNARFFSPALQFNQEKSSGFTKSSVRASGERDFSYQLI
jgi:hypothetical protein